MTVYAITDTKKGRTGIAPTYLHTTREMVTGQPKGSEGLTIYFAQLHRMRRPQKNLAHMPDVFSMTVAGAGLSHWTGMPVYSG